MPHFLIENIIEENNTITIANEEILKHLLVMRTQVGEIVKFINKDKFVIKGETLEISKKIGKFKVVEKFKSQRELKYNITLCLPILKNALNEAISNATQIGVKKIQPIYSDFCAVKKNSIKIEKLEKIIIETFKQCERADIPIISKEAKLREFLKNKKNVIIYGEREVNTTLKDAIKNISQDEEITIVIGPEGGFSDSEFEFFKENNFPIVTLGNTILKAENAIIAGVSNLIYELSR